MLQQRGSMQEAYLLVMLKEEMSRGYMARTDNLVL